MGGRSSVRLLSVLLVVALAFAGFVGLTFLAPNAQAATWTQDTDADFNLGTLSGTEVVGTGAPATVQLIRDATDWRNELPGTNPGPREGPAIAYDATNGLVVLFGGYDGVNLGDTWEYTPGTNTWTQTSTTGPSPRAYAGLTFDSFNGTVVLFGGVSDLQSEADTWEYNAATNTWYQTTPATSPPAMGSYSLTYDSTAQRVILVGQSLVTSFMVTWAYDVVADTWANRAATFSPPRSGQAITYDAALDRTVLFGGSFLFTTYGDTWEYNYGANSWTNTVPDGSGATARTNHGLSYRTTDNAVWLFGGVTGAGPASDTWRYFDVGGTRTWTNVPTQRSPPARSLFGITDEASASKKSFIYGGVLAGGGRASDTWSLGPAYRSTGFFTSRTFDSGGANVNWNTLSWVPTSQPALTTLRFQIAASNDPAGPWNYLGPNCAGNTYYTVSGTATCTSQDGMRYLRVQGNFLSSNNLNTPSLDSSTIDYTVAPSDPYIVLTDPANAQFGVPEPAPIFIRFSEEMETSSVTWIISPSTTVTPSWSESNSSVSLSHASPFLECTAYTVTITAGTDLAGNPLNNGLNLVPNPFSFVTRCTNPTITATNPAQGTTDIPLNAPIIIDFSEAMDTATVSWNLSPTIVLSPTWSNGDRTLTLTHTADFPQCEMHTVNITGKDLAGLSLLPGAVPNPFDFHTVCTIPFIMTTSPVHLGTGVATNANIVVDFSEPMQTATVTWSITPATALVPTWTNGDRTLTLSHAVPWSVCTMVTMQITGGKDLDGNDLWPGQHESHAPNPWKFAVTCANPFIIITLPQDGDVNVSQTADIMIQFSEPMNPATVTFTINPSITLTPNWNPQNLFLTLTHTTPFLCGVNTVTITGGQDVDGNPLVPGLAPNPWTFTPLCPNPFIASTSPAADETGVALTRDIVVQFSTAMNTASVIWTILPDVTLTATWSAGDTVLTLTHAAPFNQSTQYTVFVDGNDVDGDPLIGGPVPNPWRFTTVGVNPYIVSTDPVDGSTNVPTAQNVVITFSEPMDTLSVLVVPNPVILLNYNWANGDTVLTLSHPNFAECTGYVFTVSGSDAQGDPLVAGPVPNPFDLTTVCFAPFIQDTNPANGAVDVPLDATIWVNFSEPMNTVTVNAVLVPAAGALSYTWSNGDRTVAITHSANFLECTSYQVTVAGQDPDGNSLTGGPAPNPWAFLSFCPAPQILSTNPADGSSGVALSQPVVITFSATMNTGSVVVTFAPTVGGLVHTWSGGNTILTVTHNPFVECTNYQVTVTGEDTNGKSLAPGPVPNPWTFATLCTVGAPGGLQVQRVAPSTIRLTWTAVPNADNYRVYESQNRFAAWPWTVLGTTATTTFDAVGHLTDGLTHYYVVRALRGTTEGGNSTMGVKVSRSFGFSASSTNVHWFSLPYRSPYARASDIANELTNTRVDVIAKWNPATQSSLLYYWFRGAWRGTDFTISAGDGLYVGAVSAFSWVLVGTDRAVTLSFTWNAPPLGNVNWVSLPFTGTYQRASDLVLDIEGSLGGGANTKIVEVVKWDSATQTTVRFFWQPGGWTGTDFTLAPGDAVYFTIVANFSWQPRLVTPEVP